MTDKFGIVYTDSTSTTINILAVDDQQLVAIVGKQAQIQLNVAGSSYRAIGLITDIKTVNSSFQSTAFASIAALGDEMKLTGKDLRLGSFKLQAVFVLDLNDGMWKQYGSSLPTSPSTGLAVHLLDEESLKDFVDPTLPAIGYQRGMSTTPSRMTLTDFGGSRGATHSAVLGRSGSGKSQLYSLTLCSYMKHEQHALIIVDPQGQWSNENGMIFSPQKFAKALGREVNVLRVSEDIRLPLDEDIITAILDKLDVWRKGFRRMGAENRELFSGVVVNKIINRTRVKPSSLDTDPRGLLTKIFTEIAESPSTLGRIYANGGETQDIFKRDLQLLAGLPILNRDGEEEIIDQSELDSIEESWDSLLTYFTPLLNLFSSKNLAGGHRKALGGEKGFLTSVFQIRNATSAPAPYVVLDMSPSVQLHSRTNLLGGKDTEGAMRKMLDNQEVKALILQAVFSEVKKSSELAFEGGNGNLNTQIVFDEAWRYAPESSRSPEINKLADMLEGFALDTRKYGIGWSYILQTPSDLRQGIWKQLTYVYSGYGLVGEDLKRLEGLMDDGKMLDFYRQFIPPASSGDYPFMITGPVSPLIFTNAPTFINAFDGDEFLTHNKVWIDQITQKRGLPAVTSAYLNGQKAQNRPVTPAKPDTAPRSYTIGKTAPKGPTATPSTVPAKTVEQQVSGKVETDDNNFVPTDDDYPF